MFDHVFDEQCSNLDVYENTTRCILDGVLDGYNCSGKKTLIAVAFVFFRVDIIFFIFFDKH